MNGPRPVKRGLLGAMLAAGLVAAGAFAGAAKAITPTAVVRHSGRGRRMQKAGPGRVVLLHNSAVHGAYKNGNNARKRAIPKQRKHRVRLRAFLKGRLHGRPLTAYERSWL